jgi:lipoprotein-anchoring transpeptidase ErfK/SrfK
MHRKSIIRVAVVVAVLIVGAVALYAYDSSHEDQIAEGVTVSDVDVGGMKTDEARQVIRHQVAADIERALAIKYKNHRFVIAPRQVGLRADVEGMVDDALEKSRDGNIIGRSFRDLTGGEEDVEIQPRVLYSRAAVDRTVRRVEKGLNRPTLDAKLNFPALTRVKEQPGWEVSAAELRARIQKGLTVPVGAGREVTAPVRVTQPKVTRQDLARKYPQLIVVNRPGFQLKYYRDLRLVKTYTIAIGQVGYETPAGLYRIQNKQVNPTWSVPNSDWAGSLAGRAIPPGPENPLKARWMGIYDGAGIHGTDQVGSLGTAASRGCIRMAIPEVIELYDKVPVQTPVYIA